MRQIKLVNGDLVDLMYTFRTARFMTQLKPEMDLVVKNLQGKENNDLLSLEPEQQEQVFDALTSITWACLNGCGYTVDKEEVDLIIDEMVLKDVIEMILEEQKKKEGLAKKKQLISQRSTKKK